MYWRKRELTRGQIAGQVIDVRSLTRGLKAETVARCEEYYEEMKRDGTKKLYDVDSLMEETESVKAQFEDFMKNYKADDIFTKLHDRSAIFSRCRLLKGWTASNTECTRSASFLCWNISRGKVCRDMIISFAAANTGRV